MRRRRVIMPEIPTVQLGGLALHCLTEQGAIDQIVDGRGGWVVTPNVDILRQVSEDPEVARLVASATLTLADGMPLVWASRLMGSPLPERVPGSTLIYGLCCKAASRGRSIFLLGGAPGVAERASIRLRNLNPGLCVAGCHCPPVGFAERPEEMSAIETALLRAAPDIVVVALGTPKQEQLIASLRPKMPDIWFIGAGATLSFVAGATPRAPVWVQRAGLEWLHRLSHEPRRLFRRYVMQDTPFAVRLLAGCALERARRALNLSGAHV